MKEILELIISGIGIVDGQLTIVEDYLSDYKETENYPILVENTNKILSVLKENFNTDNWNNILDMEIEDIIMNYNQLEQ